MYCVAKDRATSLGSLLQYGTGGQMTRGSITPAGTFPVGDAQPAAALGLAVTAVPSGASSPQPPSAMTLLRTKMRALHPTTRSYVRPTSVADLARQDALPAARQRSGAGKPLRRDRYQAMAVARPVAGRP